VPAQLPYGQLANGTPLRSSTHFDYNNRSSLLTGCVHTRLPQVTGRIGLGGGCFSGVVQVECPVTQGSRPRGADRKELESWSTRQSIPFPHILRQSSCAQRLLISALQPARDSGVDIGTHLGLSGTPPQLLGRSVARSASLLRLADQSAGRELWMIAGRQRLLAVGIDVLESRAVCNLKIKLL